MHDMKRRNPQPTWTTTDDMIKSEAMADGGKIHYSNIAFSSYIKVANLTSTSSADVNDKLRLHLDSSSYIIGLDFFLLILIMLV